MTPGRKLLTTTSAVSTRRSAAVRSASDFRFRATLRLLRLRLANTGLLPPSGSSPTLQRDRSPLPAPFDLDDVGAVVAQHLGAAGPHHHLGEIEDPHAGEGKRAGVDRSGVGRCWAASVAGFMAGLGGGLSGAGRCQTASVAGFAAGMDGGFSGAERHQAASVIRALPAGWSPGSAPWARICF